MLTNLANAAKLRAMSDVATSYRYIVRTPGIMGATPASKTPASECMTSSA